MQALEEQLDETFRNFAAIPADPPPKRDICKRCRRPVSVCWCLYLPPEPIETTCTTVILQHPYEEKRCLRTAPMLLAALPSRRCHIVQGRKFSPNKSCFLEEIFASPHTILLYPGQEAVDIIDLPSVEDNGHPYNLILLDGTWAQARSMYHNNKSLHNIKQIKLCNTGTSEYVIRTQPTENCLSTVESAAIALAILEKKMYIKEVLLRPLKALCQFQLQHGAVEHQSKEFLVQKGHVQLPIAKRTRKKLQKAGLKPNICK